MGTSHYICARVHISYPNGSKEIPKWTDEQVNKIMKQSPLFERQILRLMQYPQYVWNIKPEEKDGFHDVSNLGHFIANLGRQPASQSEVAMEIAWLSSRCSALWYFEVVPSKVYIASQARDTNGTIIDPIAAIPITSSQTTLASGGSGSPVATVPGNSNREPSQFCWNYGCNLKSKETSLPLANVALILDWREVFKRQIKTVIWDWPKQTLAGTNTPIEFLQHDGVEGLDRRRKQELEKIKEWFAENFTNNSKKLPKQIRNLLSSPIEFDDQNPYEWMQSLQKKLLPPMPSNAHSSPKTTKRQSMTSQNTITSKTAETAEIAGHHRGRPSGLSFHQVLEKKAAEMLDKPETRIFIEDKLREAHKLIEERQNKVAEELLAWRHSHVARWKKVLDEKQPPQETSQVTTAEGSTQGSHQLPEASSTEAVGEEETPSIDSNGSGG